MDRMPLDALPDALPDAVDMDKHVICTYYARLPPFIDATEVAWAAAVEQSTGTWTLVPGETAAVRKRHVAKVIGLHEVPQYEYGLPSDLDRRHYVIIIVATAPSVFVAVVISD